MNSLLEKVKCAALTMQRYDWEQGVVSQAFLEAGDTDTAILLAIVASGCFILGIGVFPYSLLSIGAGVSLLYVLWKRDKVETYLMLIPIILFMARCYISE